MLPPNPRPGERVWDDITTYRGIRRMEYSEIAAKRREQLESYCIYAPFASLRGYSPFPIL
jgi:hypothetical protein